ncbi:DMT family transporter [Porphyromonas sp.]|uniref:DMT family transporter n=1 Tax=Porphyromonas sp. TaxID=1924944 RepID=UPI0026DC2E9D|nr:DMT family transporter [Porphyromonas sp.]MDO4695712.1 DMT family transporter [Porphyromonas sp.]MDO4771108.1 DMT family transporter [Porphyromonas sp.]
MSFLNIDKSKALGHLAILGANVMFAVNIPIAKTLVGPEGIHPLAISFTRFTGAMICFWLISLFLPKEKVDRKDLIKLFFAGLCAVGINQVLFAIALEYTTPLDIALINTTGPIFTLLMATIFLKEPLTPLKSIGVGLGAVGAIWLALLSNSAESMGGTKDIRSIGILLVAISVLAYAVYLTVFKDVINKYHPITLMKWMFTFAFILTTPFFLPMLLEADLGSRSPEFLMRLGYVVIFATFFAYLLIPVSQKRLRPTVVSMYIYIQPLIAGLVSIIVGMDVWHWNRVPAMLLIFVGVYLVTQSKSKKDLRGLQKS